MALTFTVKAQIIQGEYFIDNDPGLGNGIPFTVPPGTDVSRDLTIDVDTLSNSIHLLYTRVLDINGKWSLTNNYPFLKVTPSNRDISQAEYFWDSDPGLGNGTQIPITSDSAIDITFPVNISTIDNGLHILYVRVKNDQNFWSLTETRPVYKIGNSNTPIQRVEYFWNTDPGEGNATPVTFTPASDIQIVANVDLSTIPDGFNNLYFRVQNQNGFWSLTSSRPFLKLVNPTVDVDYMEYFFDNDPGEGMGIPVTFTSDTNVTISFQASFDTLDGGFHNLYVRVRNSLGFWSLTNYRPFYKVANPNSDIVQAEYFIDNDPGIGQATQIPLDSIVKDVTKNFIIDLTNISGGFHNLYIRVKSDENLWSLTHNRPFYKTSGGADLIGFEYFFDNEPGHGNGNPVSFANPTSDTTWSGIVDLTGIPQGYHRIYIRALAEDGFWSLTNYKYFAWCDGPQIRFSPTADTFCLGVPVTFIDSTINLNTTTKYAWDFESDGIVDDTTIGNVTHTYLDTGTYFATLIATNFDTCYDSVAVRVVVLPPPVAEFYADTACHTFATSFSDSSFTALPAGYSWDFDNDFQADSTTVGDVQHVFPNPGIFSVNLLLDMGYGCLDTFSSDVLVKTQPFPLFSSPGNCLGERTFITDLSNGVLPTASYSWDVLGNGGVFDTTTGDINLIYPDSGLYQVSLIIDNNNGCVDTATRGVKIHSLPLLDAQQTSPTCFGGFDGEAIVNVLGSPSAYTFRWSDENNQNTQTAVGLYARRYFVSVTDSNGCYNRDTVDVINPPKIQLDVVTTDATCGQNNGTATLSILSGVPPYKWYWTNGDTTLTATNLSAGIYIATVEDAENCSNIIPALVNNTNAPTASINSETPVSCFGLDDGAIDVDVTGGQTPYAFKWSNQATTEDISGLEPGPYELMVMGNDSCISFARGIVDEPDPILVDVEGFESYCGLPAGSAIASAIGGSGPKSYVWSTGGTNPTVNNLSAGVYTVDVSDTNNCTERGYVAISDTGSATIFIDSLIDVTCGQVNGGMYIKVLRVRGEPSFLWNNGDTTEDLVNVDIGLHYVEVADSNNCKAFEFGVLEYIAPIPNPVCVVTVDSATESIWVGWERLQNPAVESYNIYKESTEAGVYHLIGNVPFNAPGIFVDSFSNIQNRWWKYKITVLDSCGNESDINAVAAAPHKTMQLNASINSSLDSIYLVWDPYIGFTYNYYHVYRYTDVDGFNFLDSVTVPTTNYLDVTFPQADTILYWVIANNALSCDPYKDPDYTRTRSNPASIAEQFAGFTWIEEDKRFRVYPNPASNKLYLSHSDDDLEFSEISIKNLNGSIVHYDKKYDKEKGIDLEKLSGGVYFMDLKVGDRILHRKIIKE